MCTHKLLVRANSLLLCRHQHTFLLILASVTSSHRSLRSTCFFTCWPSDFDEEPFFFFSCLNPTGGSNSCAGVKVHQHILLCATWRLHKVSTLPSGTTGISAYVERTLLPAYASLRCPVCCHSAYGALSISRRNTYGVSARELVSVGTCSDATCQSRCSATVLPAAAHGERPHAHPAQKGTLRVKKWRYRSEWLL